MDIMTGRNTFVLSIGYYEPLALKELIPTWFIIFWEWTATRESSV